ncbi:MAG: UDP-N-acetylmuramoyl-L-alanine--D-glutamate ligase [Caldilineaceae bacterium]
MTKPPLPNEFHNKRVVILGLARQGSALARFFHAAGAQVTINDAAPAEKLSAELTAIADLPVELVLGEHPLSLLDGCDLLCLSGGVPAQLPIVQEAIRRGIRLSNDSLLTCQLAPCPVIAITGSSGKTTTTTLVGQMLRQATRDSRRTVHVGGNIGLPLIDRLDTITTDDLIVLELSSFQLELFDPTLAYGDFAHLPIDVAAILNITPNHLDRHASMTTYADAKFNLLRRLKPSARVVLSADDPVTERIARGAAAASTVPADWEMDNLLDAMHEELAARPTAPILFSRRQTLACGAWLADEQLIYDGASFCARADVHLRGDHNVTNLLAAAAISGAAMDVSTAAMGDVARSFAGVPHRLEEVAQIGGVTWINDSIATAPERAIAGLRVFAPGEQTLILLAGGKDKKLPWQDFADEVLRRVNYLIGFGDAGAMIVEAVQERAADRRLPAPSCAVLQRLDQAVHLAAQIADDNTVVLLSPGGTSYDAYKNFEERGEHFRSLVRELIRSA